MISLQKQLLLQVAAALSVDDFDHVGGWFTDDFKLHEPAQPECRNKIPGVKVEALDMLEEGDRVAVRWLFSATREGELQHLSAVAIYRFSNGLIAEDWGIVSRATWL